MSTFDDEYDFPVTGEIPALPQLASNPVPMVDRLIDMFFPNVKPSQRFVLRRMVEGKTDEEILSMFSPPAYFDAEVHSRRSPQNNVAVTIRRLPEGVDYRPLNADGTLRAETTPVLTVPVEKDTKPARRARFLRPYDFNNNKKGNNK